MDENRKVQRSRTLKAGTISLHLGGAIDCTIRNLSSTGANLEVVSPVGIPDDFILVVRLTKLSIHAASYGEARIGWGLFSNNAVRVWSWARRDRTDKNHGRAICGN